MAREDGLVDAEIFVFNEDDDGAIFEPEFVVFKQRLVLPVVVVIVDDERDKGAAV